MCKYLLITVAVLQAWRSAPSHSSGLAFDRGLPLNLSSTLTGPGFLPIPLLLWALFCCWSLSWEFRCSSRKECERCVDSHICFSWHGACCVCLSEPNKCGGCSGQTLHAPQEKGAVAGDHHELYCLDLKGTAMKLIGAFK